MPERFEDLSRSVRQHDLLNQRRRLVVRRPDGCEVDENGRRLINFAANDYLGLLADPPAWRQSGEWGTAPDRLGPGAGASPLVTGWSEAHRRLAASIASFERTEAAVVFSSGFAACCGTVATLCREGDLLLSDALNHASLIDGCRLSRATRLIYRHNDLPHLETLLRQHRGAARRTWIVTDSVFSMDGDVAPLRGLVELANRYEAELIVDEAHATGVLGKQGRGLCEATGLEAEVAIRIGTLSKAIGLQGGFVAAPEAVIDYLVQNCRTLIYATALSPLIAELASETFRQLPLLTDRRRKLRQNIGLFCRLDQRSNQPADTHVPIRPWIIGDEATATKLSDKLASIGFLVPAIRPPTVPRGTSRLRICLSAAHREGDVCNLALQCDELFVREIEDGPPDV